MPIRQSNLPSYKMSRYSKKVGNSEFHLVKQKKTKNKQKTKNKKKTKKYIEYCPQASQARYTLKFWYLRRVLWKWAYKQAIPFDLRAYVQIKDGNKLKSFTR